MSRIVLFVAAAFCAAGAQAGEPPAPGAEAPAVTVPTFANANCPIMGKKASLKLFVDTPKGRIYMCCVKCAKEIRKDPDRARAAAYPKIEKAKNTVCPVTGEAIPEKDAPTVVLQGYLDPALLQGLRRGRPEELADHPRQGHEPEGQGRRQPGLPDHRQGRSAQRVRPRRGRHRPSLLAGVRGGGAEGPRRGAQEGEGARGLRRQRRGREGARGPRRPRRAHTVPTRTATIMATTATTATAIMASSRPARARTWSSAALAPLLTSCAALPPMPPPPPTHPASPEAEEAPPPPVSAALAPRPPEGKKPAAHEHGKDLGGMR